MNTEILNKINEKLNCLHTILSTLLPTNSISIHPIIYFEDKYIQLIRYIDKIIEESLSDQVKLKNYCLELSNDINTKCEKLNIPEPRLPNFINYNMNKEYLQNEDKKIEIYELEINIEINQWIKKTRDLYFDLYNSEYNLDKKEISINYLSKLKAEFNILNDEKTKKELQRSAMYKEIKKCLRLLGITDTVSINDKIFNIENKYDNYKKLLKEREREVRLLTRQIEIKKELFKNTSFLEDIKENFVFEQNVSLSKEYVENLKTYLEMLEMEYNRRINEIYDGYIDKLNGLLKIFGMNEEVYEKSDTGIAKLSHRINELEIKKDSYVEILNLIEKRYTLLKSMNEFEKIASDPRRLFQSSFQLNKEEKFRKSAYPSLLNIEEEIHKKITDYTEKYGIYYREGEEYQNVLNKEIEDQYKIHRSDYKKSDTLVLDNGTYELKGGYLGDTVAIKFQNCFYKDVEGIKYESIRGKNKYTPFTYDMISGLHVLEENVDQIMEYLKIKECENLIITDPIYSPTKKDLLKFLFEVYHFKKIQVGIDAIYSYLLNKGSDNGIVISFGHVSITVYVIRDKKIKDVYKINYGGKSAINYLTSLLRYKYRECNKDCTVLIRELKCAINYDDEVFGIVEKMKKWDYQDSVCINSEEEKEIVVVDDERRNRLVERLKNMNRKKKKIEESEEESIDEVSFEEENEDEEEIFDKTNDEVENEDEINDEANSKDEINDGEEVTKKTSNSKFPGMYRMRCYQYNMRLSKILKRFSNLILRKEEEYEKLTNLPLFLKKKKTKYEQILRELELREKCRKDSTNRKTYEFSLLLKTGELTKEEIEYKRKIKECEDTEIDEKLNKEKDDLLELINIYDSNYILEMSNVIDLICGKHIKKTLLNIDLLRVSEVIFEPSLLGSDQMGLSEILENILTTYKDMNEVFLTGGFSQIKGLKERIKNECIKFGYNKIKVREAEDVVHDGYNGAFFSDLFPTYTYKDYLEEKLD